MLGLHLHNLYRLGVRTSWQWLPLLALGLVLISQPVYGDSLFNRSLQLSSISPSATADYRLTFTLANSETLGSIEIEFCSNDPILTDPCSIPTGLDASNAVLTSQSGASGFSIGSGTNTNTVVLSRTPGLAGPATLQYAIGNMTNPSSSGTFYGRVQTFASSDASGPNNDFGGLAISIGSGLSIQTFVPPYLLFCVGVSVPAFNCDQASGNYVDFGTVSASSTASAQTNILVATNGQNGYSIEYSGNSLTSGNNVIAPLASPSPAQPGVNQFGLNLVANQLPKVGSDPAGPGSGNVAINYAQANIYRFVSGDTVASSSQVSDFKEYTVSYITNVARSQPVGVYAGTLTYVGIANF